MMDTGCSRMVAGMYWYLRFKQILRKFGLGCIEFTDSESYKFGPGPVTKSLCAALIPVGIGGRSAVFRISIVRGDVRYSCRFRQ